MSEFRALLGGKVVSYSAKTKFVIEQREGRGKYSIKRNADNISHALTHMGRLERIPNTTTRLRCAEKGRFKTLQTVKAKKVA